MHPPVRDQADFLDFTDQEHPDFEPGITCTAEEDKARQEFKQEADLNFLMRKYGALPPVTQFPQGEVDFDVDLLTARVAVQEARDGYGRLPADFREAVSFDQFMVSLANGEAFPARPASPVSGEAGRAAPSESAAA